MTYRYLLFMLAVIVLSCKNGEEKTGNDGQMAAADTLEMIQSFLYGLWSENLENSGYYLKPDGTVDFVATGRSGWWKLQTADTLKIVYSDFNEQRAEWMVIDTLSSDRMKLKTENGYRLLRKVPYGVNVERSLIKGFAGSLDAGEHRDYTFDIPAAKKISVLLRSENSNLVFDIYDGPRKLTVVPVREWDAIMIRSGKYTVRVTHKATGIADYDVKIFTW